jgi:HEAT repeat protein
MAPSAELTALVNKMPDWDKDEDPKKRGDNGKLTGPDWKDAEAVYDDIFKGGKANVVGVIDMIVLVDKGDDFKARYVLNGLGLHSLRSANAQKRSMYVDALASQIGGDRPKPIQAFLIQQLQAFGDKRAVPALCKCLLDEELCDPATAAMVAIREGVAEPFRQALPKAKGKQRLAIVQALGVLGDAASIPAMKEAAADQNVDVRLVAIWGLANVGDAGSCDLLIKASGADGWERIQATKACLLLAENLLAKGNKTGAAKIYGHLSQTRTDKSEEYVRDAAAKGLAAAG